ncbi:MAG: hypothetical protein M3P04_13145 [Actinomycetota bacterium]|nr:hypothetical protein [Actinomycetota bacterium]
MPYALELRQRFTPLQNRYDLIGFHNGTEELVGYAEQKRLALKEKITFYANDAKTEIAFTLGARNIMELVGTYDVQAADGSVLATIKKNAATSLLRSTYDVVTADGRQLLGQERTMWKALFRRFVDIPLFPIQFDVTDRGHVLITVDRIMKIRDCYRVEVQDDAMDWRVAAAIAVSVDAFMNR